jgi:hypothetical protein
MKTCGQHPSQACLVLLRPAAFQNPWAGLRLAVWGKDSLFVGVDSHDALRSLKVSRVPSQHPLNKGVAVKHLEVHPVALLLILLAPHDAGQVVLADFAGILTDFKKAAGELAETGISMGTGRFCIHSSCSPQERGSN